MLKFFSFGKVNAGVLITLLVLIVLGCSYFFIYIPKNEKVVQERRFRCLQKIDVNIHTQIDNCITQITALLKNYEEYSDTTNSKNDSLFKEFKTYIDYRKANFKYLLPYQANKYLTDASNKKPNKSGENLICFREDKASGMTYYIDIGSQFTLLSSKIIKVHGKTDTITLGIQYEIEQFIKPLLPSDVFDNYIIFIGDKKFYETAPLGLNYNNKDADSLLTVKSKIITPGFRSLNISGTDYKIFSHPVYTYTNNRWVITGLVSAKNYLQERNQLPLWVLLFLLTAAITMLVFLPWIKLYHMGNKDMLTVNDGVASILVSMILMSMLFFVFFKYHFSFTKDRYLYKYASNRDISYPIGAYSRNVLATKVTNAFTEEIETAYNLLWSIEKFHKKTDTDVYLLGKPKEKSAIRYDSLFDKSGQLVEKVNQNVMVEIKSKDQNAINKDRAIIDKNDSTQGLYTRYDILFKKYAHNIHPQEIYWLGINGVDSTNLTVDSNNAPKGRYLDRIYYQNAIANKYNKTGPNSFYIDQIVSRPEGVFRSVIAKKTPNNLVAAMTFTIQSLDSVIMPDGYQFAIIDSSGQVLYHSRSDRNLKENLKVEFADSSQLVSCIEAKSDTSFKAEYYGKRYNIKIKPVPDLPYFTVIFEDQEYQDTLDTASYVFTLSMLICLLLFLIIKFSAIFFVSSKKSFLKKQHFDTSWIGPKMSSQHQYNLGTIANLFIIAMLLISFNLSSFLEYLYILLISVVFTSLFLNFIFANKYKKTDPDKYKLKKGAIQCLCIFLILLNAIALSKLNFLWHSIHLIIYELILTIALLLFCYRKSTKRLKSVRSFLIRVYGKLKKHTTKFLLKIKLRPLSWTYTNSYALMATTRLIISSGIPVAFFFIYSYNYEQNLDTRYRQLNFAQSLAHKINFAQPGKTYSIRQDSIDRDNNKLNRINNAQVCTSGIYTDGLFIDSVAAINFNPQAGKIRERVLSYGSEDSLTAELLSVFRLHTNNIEVKNNNLNLLYAGNSVFFNNLRVEKREKTSKIYYKINANEYVKINSSPNINYRYPCWYQWLILLTLIFGFYYIIHNIIRKIFALNIHHTNRWIKMDHELLKNTTLNKQVLIVGSPGSDSLSKLKYWINNGSIKDSKDKPYILGDENPENTVFVADMIRIPTSWDGQNSWKKCKEQALSGYPLVIIDHFEYNISDPKSNSAKLDLLEELLCITKSKIIIISTVHPVSFIDSFNQAVQSNPTSDSDLERWHMLLGNFRVLIDPLISSYIPENAKMPEKAIFEETIYSRFLHDIQKISMNALHSEIDSGLRDDETTGRLTDSLIFKLQLTSQYFYTNIWQSLTREEKFLLYDLAEDGLVNSFDDFNLSMLICKGLIINCDGTWIIFNRGFRNFILTAIGKKEVDRIKEQIKDNGKWGNLKTPLNIAILAILVFLFASQQGEYSQVITYITALGAAIPTISKLFSVFGGGETKKASE